MCDLLFYGDGDEDEGRRRAHAMFDMATNRHAVFRAPRLPPGIHLFRAKKMCLSLVNHFSYESHVQESYVRVPFNFVLKVEALLQITQSRAPTCWTSRGRSSIVLRVHIVDACLPVTIRGHLASGMRETRCESPLTISTTNDIRRIPNTYVTATCLIGGCETSDNPNDLWSGIPSDNHEA